MNRRNLVLAAPALLAGNLFSGGPVRAAQGNVIKFGQSASLSGAQAAYGKDVRDGIVAAFAAASAADAAKGGPRYELVTLDDAGDKDRCAQNVTTLIDGGVSAIIGLTSGVGAEACMPVASQHQIALLGTASGNMALRTNNAAYHVRAGYDLEYKRMAKYIRDFGMRRIAVVYLKDMTTLNLAALNRALGGLSITPVETLAIDRNAASFADVATRLLDAKVDCVMFASSAEPVAAIIDLMTAARYPGLFYASSLAGQGLIDTLVSRKQSCVMSTVVPRPNSAGLNVVTRCQQDLAALGPDLRMGVTPLEGYIAGRTAVEATRAALRVSGGERVARNRLKDSLTALRTDLGGYRVEFAAGNTEGSQYVDLMAIDRHGRLVG
jgi:ABC-type branched-subunit amino acid transport system substrate-binding protein